MGSGHFVVQRYCLGGDPVNYVDQEIALTTVTEFGANVPLGISSALLQRLEDTARPCVRMAIEGASSSSGAPPAWLERASDIRTVGFSARGAQSILHVKAPTLGEAAPEVFDQPKLWPGMARAEDTVINLIGRVGHSVRRQETGSDMYDKRLLRHFSHWQRLFRRDVVEVHLPTSFDGSSIFATLDKTVGENARSLSDQTPLPRQVRIVGKLDMVRHSTRSFELLLDRGEGVRGVLQEGDPEILQRYFGKEITVFGKAIYRPSGLLLRIDAQEILDTTEGRAAFSSVPEAFRKVHRVQRRLQNNKVGVAAFFGTWPGDESDEELLTALGELRN
jgi:hypothetical protein